MVSELYLLKKKIVTKITYAKKTNNNKHKTNRSEQKQIKTMQFNVTITKGKTTTLKSNTLSEDKKPQKLSRHFKLA